MSPCLRVHNENTLNHDLKSHFGDSQPIYPAGEPPVVPHAACLWKVSRFFPFREVAVEFKSRGCRPFGRRGAGRG